MLRAGARDRPSTGRPLAWRAAVAAVAAALIVAAETLATLRAAAPHTPSARHLATGSTRTITLPHWGEPQPFQGWTTAPAVRTAAVRFVRDYSAWQKGRLAAIPSHDATRRVAGLLEQAGRHDGGIAPHPAKSVRTVAAGALRYQVTSVVGNFLVDRHGSRWLVVSLPGD